MHKNFLRVSPVEIICKIIGNENIGIDVHAFFAPFKKNQGQKNSKNLRSKKNSRAILNKKLSVLEST